MQSEVEKKIHLSESVNAPQQAATAHIQQRNPA